MDLPPEKQKKLLHLVQEELSSGKLNSYIDDAIANCSNVEEDDVESEVIDCLRKKGLIEEIMDNLLIESAPASPKSCDFNRREISLSLGQCICLHIHHGKAFTEFLNSSSNFSDSYLTLHVHFRGQRFRSKCVPVSCEPNFSESFFFQFYPSGDNCCKSISTETMLSISDPIHIVIIRHDSDGDITLVSSYALQWREALTDEGCSIKAIEMMGTGSENKVHAGMLEVQLQVLPKLQNFLPKKVVDAQLHLEKQRKCEKERLFLNYAKQWWKEFSQICNKLKNRPVRIFSEDESGKNRVVCAFVQPLQGCRFINSPRQAARFVSVFNLAKASCIGSTPKTEYSQSLHAFLCSKKGDHVDHSNLLCSLFLGFGLDAYVCIGLNMENCLCSWVVVRYCENSSVFFWDPTTGRRYSHHSIDPDDPPSLKFSCCKYRFKSVGCAYNHTKFFANVQPIDLVQAVNFCFENRTLWKSMDAESISAVTGVVHPNICVPLPPLNPPTLNESSLALDLEKNLKCLICQYRKEINLTTEWDDHISYLLGQSLAAYEAEKLYGLSNVGNDDFQDALLRAVPDGDTFKGFPIQFLHCNANKIFRTCFNNEVCSAIIRCRGDSIRLAVRCIVTVFPDDLVSTWVMVACRYRSIL